MSPHEEQMMASLTGALGGGRGGYRVTEGRTRRILRGIVSVVARS